MDKFSKIKRSAIMAAVKGSNTKPELAVRSLIHRLGFRFRLHVKDLPGKPDIVLPRHRKVVFVHGCFWHSHRGCKRSAKPESNKVFWKIKLEQNVARDKENLQHLKKCGWKVLVVWECELRKANYLKKKIESFLYDDELS